jgi:hypothetical protein
VLIATLSASFQNRREYIIVVSAKTPVFDSFERCKQYRHPVVSEVFMKVC